MAAYRINRNLARTVVWSTAMATAICGIEVMYEGQQWIVDQIQKINVKIAKDIAGLNSTTTGYDAIRSADTPITRAKLDRRTERHFMRILTQKNSNSDLIPDELDGMVDKEDIPTLDSWTEHKAEDLLVVGDEVEQSLPVDLEFALWHQKELIGEYRSHIDEYHGWTDGSRRVSAAFWSSLRGYNDQAKEVELDCNKGSLGECETAGDGEMEAIADIMESAIDNQIPGDLTIHSDAQAAISRVGHTGTCRGQDRAIRVVQAVQHRLRQSWCTRIKRVPGHSGIVGDGRPISSLARQLQRDNTAEGLLYGSKNGSHSILQSQQILKLIKSKKLLLPQHRRHSSWIELRIGSLGLLHRFGLGIGCVHHISNELGKN
jgi:hypothetical protein